ncbi:hypothetical protein [Pseudomonas sp. PAMC 26793]|uniref:hypothetical protein n=1 Tax=Pseudomonas TaxID=286 RepID=UPI000382C7C7|nr:hypothetical protein [Pseudomonas sp. PAMC 26793]
MSTTKAAPLNPANTTGSMKANVAHRAHFETQDLAYIADSVQFQITATAQRGSPQSSRSILIGLDADIVSGDYDFIRGGTGKIRSFVYSEVVKTGNNYFLLPATTEKASLTLHVENSNQLYRGTFTLTARTTAGLPIEITDGHFTAYLPIPPTP